MDKIVWEGRLRKGFMVDGRGDKLMFHFDVAGRDTFAIEIPSKALYDKTKNMSFLKTDEQAARDDIKIKMGERKITIIIG